ncbi:hypothetical protein B7P43_G11084 [Cryptotermes secundus]|uniref:Uncharacterized protein n=3 Tax=Cryptotermes secundus TaxID=105785 RepID=A0A2J7RFF0_9NEOP|nr:hypothetical protein B7P43_G11084 [Cryptotermes secundus]
MEAAQAMHQKWTEEEHRKINDSVIALLKRRDAARNKAAVISLECAGTMTDEGSEDTQGSGSKSETSNCDDTDNSGSDSETMEDDRMANAHHTKRELIMPWHVQDKAPQPKGQRENCLIVELNSQDVATWMTNRETRKTKVNAATASIHLTEMIAETHSSRLTEYDNFLGDATVGKEGPGVCINAAKIDPDTEYKRKEPGMTSDVSNLTTAMNGQVLDAETVQLQDAEVRHRQTEGEAVDYRCEKGGVLCTEMVNLQLRDHDNEITSLEDICDRREALGREIMQLQYLKNEFKKSNDDNEMIPLEGSCEEHEVQGKEIVELQKLGDDYTDNGRILEDPCKKCEKQGTRIIELQDDYNENEWQDEGVCVSSSARKETVNMGKALSEFLTDFNSKHTDTAETGEHVSHKTPSNGIIHSKYDNREQQEETEEGVNRDNKKTTVTEHVPENMEIQTEMSVHVGNKEEVGKYSSEGQIKRYVNSSLELQLINQDNINETQ